MTRLAHVLVACVVVPAWLWAVTALALFPSLPAIVRSGGMLAFVGATGAVFWRAPRAWRFPASGALALVVSLLWSFTPASDQRSWSVGQERAPRVAFAGDTVTIDNVRNATWRSATESDMRWETRHFDLRALRTVELVVEPFDDWRGLAHIFVTFGFEGGEHIAVSIESRREEGEHYSPLKGAFRHFELLYVVGDERDLIGLRANIRRDPVYLFPTQATPDEARALFISMLRRADELASRPEFYNTATATCATELLRHVNEVRTHDVSALDWRILFPGYADELAWDLGLIHMGGTLEEARARHLINERSAFDPAHNGPAWSRKIRTAP